MGEEACYITLAYLLAMSGPVPPGGTAQGRANMDHRTTHMVVPLNLNSHIHLSSRSPDEVAVLFFLSWDCQAVVLLLLSVSSQQQQLFPGFWDTLDPMAAALCKKLSPSLPGLALSSPVAWSSKAPTLPPS